MRKCSTDMKSRYVIFITSQMTRTIGSTLKMSVVKNKSALASRIKSWFNFEIIMGFRVNKTNLAETGTTHGLLDKVKTGLTCRRRSIGDIGTAGHDRFKWEAALGAGNGDKSLET